MPVLVLILVLILVRQAPLSLGLSFGLGLGLGLHGFDGARCITHALGRILQTPEDSVWLGS